MYFLSLLINFVVNTYVFILLLRLLLQKLGGNWHNPVTHLVVRITDPVVKPLRRLIPGFKGFDLAIVLAMLILEFVGAMLLLKINYNTAPKILGCLVISIIYLGNKVLSLYFWGIILSAIMSWVPALRHNPIAGIVGTIVEPLLNIARRFIPAISGMDFSPIVLLLLLKAVEFFVFAPIISFGYRLAY